MENACRVRIRIASAIGLIALAAPVNWNRMSLATLAKIELLLRRAAWETLAGKGRGQGEGRWGKYLKVPKINQSLANFNILQQCVNLSRYIAQQHHLRHHHQQQQHRPGSSSSSARVWCRTSVIDLVNCHFHVSFSKLLKFAKTRQKREKTAARQRLHDGKLMWLQKKQQKSKEKYWRGLKRDE